MSFTASDLYQRADNVSHHVLQKSVRLHLNFNQPFFSGHNFNIDNCPHTIFDIGPCCAKTGKIMRSDDEPDSLPHARNIERVTHMPEIITTEDGSQTLIANSIYVYLTFDVPQSMKIVRPFFQIFDHNIRRQHTVDAHKNLLNGQCRITFETSDLVHGMHTGVRAPGTNDRHVLTGDFFNRLFEQLLDGNPVMLPLPAAVGSSVVFHRYFKIAHSDSE
ncbi:MAG: hypothetical protein BWX55_00224 [Deltaproteobacteria bacterium ADurb.Bin022]|nr:MAG: hypothetical protein BWX55_00224 [Deltaproteobacteria bacterium ADurb.Bin022]